MQAERSRLFGLDLARGIAILAMVVVNVHLAVGYGSREPRWLLEWTELFEGRAASLFVVIAGYGVVLLGSRRTLVRRALCLLVLGYGWQLVWSGDILHYYGVYLLLAAAILPVPRWALGLCALVAIAAFVGLFGQLEYGAGWNWTTLEYPEFWTAEGQVRNLLFNGWHPVFPWFAFLCCGMILGRSRLHERALLRRAVLVAAALVTVLAGMLASRLSSAPDEHVFAWWRNAEYVWGVGPIPPMPLFVCAAAGSAVASLCVCLELGRLRIVRILGRPLADAGRLSLTLYVLHVLIGVHVFDMLGWWDRGRLIDVWWRTSVFATLALVCAPIWCRLVGHGPLEWALRRVSR